MPGDFETDAPSGEGRTPDRPPPLGGFAYRPGGAAFGGVRVELDWDGYWRAFREAHGDNPLEVGGRLLFRDGWTYSASDPSGPEWPPPADPNRRAKLIARYWSRRRDVCHAELVTLKHQLEKLKGLAACRSAPLQQRATFADPETGRLRQEKGPLDLAGMEGRLAWLAADVALCDEQLKELNCEQGRTAERAGTVAVEE